MEELLPKLTNEDAVRSDYLRDFLHTRRHRGAYEKAIEKYLMELCPGLFDRKDLVRLRKLLTSEDAHCCLTFIWKESDFVVEANLARDIRIKKRFAERDLSANALTGDMLDILRDSRPEKKDALKRRIDEIIKAAEQSGLVTRREVHTKKKLINAAVSLDQIFVDLMEHTSGKYDRETEY